MNPFTTKIAKVAIITSGLMLFSGISWACNPNDPHYQSCIYHNVIAPQMQQQNQSGYYYPSRSTRRGGTIFFLGLAWDKNRQPFFHRVALKSPVDADHEGMQEHTVAACNASAERRPCIASVSVYGGCIAVARSIESSYAVAEANSNSCGSAKRAAKANCKSDPKNPDPKGCKLVSSKHAIPFLFR